MPLVPEAETTHHKIPLPLRRLCSKGMGDSTASDTKRRQKERQRQMIEASPDIPADEGRTSPPVLTSDSRATVYQENDTWIFRASGWGKCPHKLAAIAHGRTEYFGPHITRAFRQGCEIEKIVLHRLADAGLKIAGEQSTIELHLLGGAAIVRGHWDGFYPTLRPLPWFTPGVKIPEGIPGVLEIKSASADSYDKFIRFGRDAFPEYVAQTDAYCHWLRTIGGKPNAGILFAFQAKDQLDDLHLRYYPEPSQTLDELDDRAGSILAAIYAMSAGELPPCPHAKDQQFPCAFADLHTQDEQPVDIATADNARAVWLYVDLGRKIKVLEDDRKQLLGNLTNAMGQSKKAAINDFRINRIETNRTDHGRFFRDNPDQAERLAEYSVSSSYIRVTPPAEMPPMDIGSADDLFTAIADSYETDLRNMLKTGTTPHV